MDGYINVKAPPTGSGIPAAVGAHNDRAAIQSALNALVRWGVVPGVFSDEPCGGGAETDYPSWAAFPAGLYFPPGAYRICGALEMPFLRHVHILGAGARGGIYGAVDGTYPNLVVGPLGSVIVQHENDAPIFRFDHGDCHDVTIEGLGFRWLNRQEPPAGWAPRQRHTDPLPSGYTAPGAVAVLFSAGGRAPATVDDHYYHITIRDCQFERGWRGVGIDETYDGGNIAVWNTRIEGCGFHAMRGAAVSLVNHPDHYIGMPSNAITDCFVENYSHIWTPLGNSYVEEYARRNVEQQVRVVAQTGMRIDGLDAEGSKTTVLYAGDSQVSMRDLYLEHLRLGGQLRNGAAMEDNYAPYASVLSLWGGEYTIEGLHVDGTLNARDANDNPTFSQLIYATDLGRGASVVVSGARARPLSNPTGDLDVVDGFHFVKGPCYFLHTNDGGGSLARFRMVGESHLEATSADPFTLFLQADEVAARVEREPRVVRVSLSFPSIPVGRVRPHNPFGFAGLPFDGARVGDLVAVAPPASFPARCIAHGVVTAADTLEVRVMNGADAAVTPPSGVWTVAFGRGANDLLHAPAS